MTVGQPLADEHWMKIGATHLGITLDEYRAKKEAGLKWCWPCQSWKPATLDVFDAQLGVRDGLQSRCKACASRILAAMTKQATSTATPSCVRHRPVRGQRFGPTPEPVDVLICWGCGDESDR